MESTTQVKYIGCLGIKESMKNMNFETRSVIAKECILRVSESAGLQPHTEYACLSLDPKVKDVVKMLDKEVDLTYSLSLSTLSVSSSALVLSVTDTGEEIAYHLMPDISFASGGDGDTKDFVAYVAKDVHRGRACFVLQCNPGQAQEVISTIGEAFEVRFQELMRKKQDAKKMLPSTCHSLSSTLTRQTTMSDPDRDNEYYNDQPGE